MTNLLSPYELLKKCRPVRTAVFVTSYDDYSAAQGSELLSSQPSSPSLQSNPPPVTSFAKTHYIADIKARHNRASDSVRTMTRGAVDYTSPSDSSSSIQSPQQ